MLQQLRPLQANIEREMKRLAEIARPGSQVVVYFSGHEAQQTNDNPDDPDDDEPGGLGELLLPADIKPDMDSDSPTVPNAITDDELRVWLNAIQKKAEEGGIDLGNYRCVSFGNGHSRNRSQTTSRDRGSRELEC